MFPLIQTVLNRDCNRGGGTIIPPLKTLRIRESILALIRTTREIAPRHDSIDTMSPEDQIVGPSSCDVKPTVSAGMRFRV